MGGDEATSQATLSIVDDDALARSNTALRLGKTHIRPRELVRVVCRVWLDVCQGKTTGVTASHEIVACGRRRAKDPACIIELKLITHEGGTVVVGAHVRSE